MIIDESRLSSTTLLARRLLWNRAPHERPAAQPVVVLLGPAGAGKTTALRSISGDCGSAVVHASLDFDHPVPVTTIDALTWLADALSQRWTARRPARFTRFTLGLLAIQAPLDGLTRDAARERLRDLIREFTRNPRADRIAAQVRVLAEAARTANILTAPVAETITAVLPPLIRTIGRKPVGKAQRWHSDIPEAEGASPLDALVSLNRRAHEQPEVVTAWLTAAFLADIRDNHEPMAKPELDTPCDCAAPHRAGPHYHNWVLLLDNIDHPGGTEFISDLCNARERHLAHHPGVHDALVVIATSGRWNTDWQADWRPPWTSEPRDPDGLRTVPRCRDASRQHWTGHPPPEHPPPQCYPVLLEPLRIDETARILGTTQFSRECVLVQRATGGLPRAVHDLVPSLHHRTLPPGGRDALLPAGPAPGAPEAWHARVRALRLTKHLPDFGVAEFVTAAPFATAPWLVPAEATSLVSRPQVGQILTELRTALWVIAPDHNGGTEDHCELHPWIARNLISALAARCTTPDTDSYESQFQALLDDPDTQHDPVRTAYCQLALGHISDVISFFEASFNRCPHQQWVDRLRLVTRAPDSRALDRDCAALYQELVTTDTRNNPQGRSPVGNIVTQLVVARWLAANPFATPDPDLKPIIEKAYVPGLLAWNRRPDVAALIHAAKRDIHDLF